MVATYFYETPVVANLNYKIYCRFKERGQGKIRYFTT